MVSYVVFLILQNLWSLSSDLQIATWASLSKYVRKCPLSLQTLQWLSIPHKGRGPFLHSPMAPSPVTCRTSSPFLLVAPSALATPPCSVLFHCTRPSLLPGPSHCPSLCLNRSSPRYPSAWLTLLPTFGLYSNIISSEVYPVAPHYYLTNPPNCAGFSLSILILLPNILPNLCLFCGYCVFCIIPMKI